MTIPLEVFYRFFIILMRVSCIYAFLPFLNDETIPVKIRVGIVLIISLILYPGVTIDISNFPTNIVELLIALLPEFFIGMCIGLVGRLITGAVQISGQVIGDMMGFGMANAFDPIEQNQIIVIGEIQYMMAISLFLILDLHHIFLMGMYKTFLVVPPFQIILKADILDFILKESAQMFVLAMQIAAPVTVSMLFVNFAMASISKVVPHLNVFMESFPIRIIVGIIILIGSMGMLIVLITNIFKLIPDKLDTILKFM